MVECLALLRPIADRSVEEYKEDPYRKGAAERFFQKMVEAAADINAHLAAELGREAPEDYYRSFIRLANLGVISRSLAESVAPFTGVRNRLVHEYDEIDDACVLEAIREAQRLIPRYIEGIEAFLGKQGL
jgi:uncharacterized protein YutE (UPF0331/DUF86 family)